MHMLIYLVRLDKFTVSPQAEKTIISQLSQLLIRYPEKSYHSRLSHKPPIKISFIYPHSKLFLHDICT